MSVPRDMFSVGRDDPTVRNAFFDAMTDSDAACLAMLYGVQSACDVS